MIRHALNNHRSKDFASWYQELISAADLAEESGVRGCMIMRPWGYGIWERMQALLDREIKATGHENCYFPLFIPLSYFEKEAEHVDGFAKEMAVVTHHRLTKGEKGLIVDPDAKLEEPLVVRPTSETVIGTAFSRWLQSWRDLPLLYNQWANVVRWEMRTRMFLRTSEFLWQEGHTAHETREDAVEETMKMLEVYRSFAEDKLAMPVIAGVKPENERFPGAEDTYSIEAMMQDGKALQAGTSHFLGHTFAKAQNIRFQDRNGDYQYAYTTSWGVSTRMIGGVIMSHGDDDGLRLPPAIAPQQIIIIPMLKENDGDEQLLNYCKKLKSEVQNISVLGEPVRVLLDVKATKPSQKRWSWVKKGAPIIIEVGARDMDAGKVSFLIRHQLYQENGKPNFHIMGVNEFADNAGKILEDMQASLFNEAKHRTQENIIENVENFNDVKKYYANAGKYPGWVKVNWARPTGAELEEIVKLLKSEKLTFRNSPIEDGAISGRCIFTGRDAVESIYIARAY
ncbi:proline--tRNA ligase [Sphingorhabdus lutea]|uniref:Proline--tRNA ligase n=1 Tax=Sphingorhabdus lutea TaxID=1913578 RepID=A0A1L3JC10_9SPHN|nr:proline--tRNA ligase [Sphingorhabdus lutea]APG62675.1 proline--tRNA ligase [Sphingorhabdus lutea]